MLEQMADNVRAAITADPLDTTARLVLSDLLEDLGDQAGAERERATVVEIDRWLVACQRCKLERVAPNCWESKRLKRRYSFHLDTGYARRYIWTQMGKGYWDGSPLNPRAYDPQTRQRARYRKEHVVSRLYPEDLLKLLTMLRDALRRDMKKIAKTKKT